MCLMPVQSLVLLLLLLWYQRWWILCYWHCAKHSSGSSLVFTTLSMDKPHQRSLVLELKMVSTNGQILFLLGAGVGKWGLRANWPYLSSSPGQGHHRYFYMLTNSPCLKPPPVLTYPPSQRSSCSTKCRKSCWSEGAFVCVLNIHTNWAKTSNSMMYCRFIYRGIKW